MIKYKQQTRVEMITVVDEIICDWCGKNFMIYERETDCAFPCGGTVHVNFGYGSRFDTAELKEYTGDVCDDCFEKHMKSRMKKEVR